MVILKNIDSKSDLQDIATQPVTLKSLDETPQKTLNGGSNDNIISTNNLSQKVLEPIEEGGEQKQNVKVLFDVQKNSSLNIGKQEQKHKSNMKIYAHCIIVCLGSLFVGYNVGVLNLAQPRLNLVYGLEDNLALYQGLLGGCLLFGGIFGCYVAAALISRIGVRNTALLIDVVAICSLSCFTIANFYVALCVRLMLGLMNGINLSLISVYIKQISPVAILGKTGSFNAVLIMVGVFTSVVVGLGFPLDEQELENHGDFYWRFALMFPIIICSIRFTCLKFIYNQNTPIYNFSKDKIEKTIKVLKSIYKDEYVQEQLKILEKQHEQQLKTKDSWSSLFKQENRQQLILGSLISSFFQLSGIMTIMFYSKLIFEETTGDKQMAINMSLGVSFIQIVTALFSGELSKHYGRRPILLMGHIVGAVILMGLGTLSYLTQEDLENGSISMFASLLSIGLVFAFCIIFRLSTGTVAWVYVADILSVKGNSVATSFQMITAFFVSMLFPIGQEKLGIYTMFYLFAVMQGVGFVYLYIRLKETKGLTQVEVYNMFQQSLSQKRLKYEAKQQNSE